MTELETTERAKMYIDKLANGINPLTDQALPDTDIINNVRISRCLFYVSGVLQQAIENAKVSTKKEAKAFFSLSSDKRSEFNFSDKPLSVSEIAERINSLTDPSQMKRFQYTSITNWLLEIGMLTEVQTADGKTVKRPTEQGKNIGIGLDERMGTHGVYHVVVYDVSAQHFVIDNLDAILEYEHACTSMQGQPWSIAHDECLMDLYRKNVPIYEIARTLKRNRSSVKTRLKKLGLLSTK